ncbi:inner ear-specific collagen [Alosa sapidissima]|uniref:inner ear-specific collagen n=1 Tax=Alosa sapidissima TaxID=34773 RepID=UPI001C09211D|nr:inner ear-specific collagen [Alosa sapidissima]
MTRFTCGSTMRSLVALLLGVAACSAMTPPPYPPPGTDYNIDRRRMLPSNDPMMMGDMGEMTGDFDTSYCEMLLNSPVPPTADQVPWFCICHSCKGTPGPKGERGDLGLQGRPGSPGRRGLTGFQGRPGFMGRPGLKGEKGDEGLKGDKGPVGFTGAKGERGFKGDKGDAGVAGPPGLAGPKGDDGECPETCEPVQGSAGEPGLPGPVGPRGLPGVAGVAGPKGMKGDMGVMGLSGQPGPVGPKGEQGQEGECNCQDGDTGAPGTQGPKGEMGDQGQQGPKGDGGAAGPKGDQGDMGMTGMPGPCTPTVQSAFSAALAYPFPMPNRPVPFPAVLNNMQGHFNPSLGMYTAPANGTYVFSYHLTVYNRVLKVGLFHNFQPVVKTTESAELATASQTVVLHLNQGDLVWLQVKDSITNGIYTSNEASSTFSGYLLQPDNCDVAHFRDFWPEPIKGEYNWGELEMPTTAAPTMTP